MKYERLTTKDEEGNWQVWEDDYSHPFEALQVAIERLAELEDKIEQGLMIELGYHIRKSYRNHDDQRYKIVIVEENDIDKIGYDCLTREEAETRLKELQE